MMKEGHALLLMMLIAGLALAGDQSATKVKTNTGPLGKRPDPPKLLVETSLETPSGHLRLFEDEYGVLDVMVVNQGELPASDVVVRTFPGRIEGVTVDSVKHVGTIPPRDTVHAKFLISTSGRIARQSIPIPVTATDAAGHLATTWQTLTLAMRSLGRGDDKLPAVATEGRTWILVIGVNDYLYWPPLENATADAQAVRNVLREHYGIVNDNVLELYDRQATRANIIRKLEYLAKMVRPEDNVVLYYAGHGKFENRLNRGYWVPADAEINSTAQYIPNTDLQSFIAAIQSRATLVISDACFSGTVFREDAPALPVRQDERYIRQVSRLKARQAIVSGGNEPVMDSGISGKHSIFAYYLVDQLTKNADRYLTASSLFERIRIPITNSSQQTPQCKPIHNTGDEGGEFVFVRRK